VRVAAISLGCPKNLVDTEVMLGLLRQAGLSIVSDLCDADVLLVNTCCFIAAAREESAQALEEAIAWRRAAAGRRVLCAGCWPAGDLEELQARFPAVDAFMGPGGVPEVVCVVERAMAGAGEGSYAAAPAVYLCDDATPRLRTTHPWTAYVKIAEGCDHRCSFCVIPRLRGRFRGRSLGSVVREARSLAAEGVLEINLIAQDTTAYRDGERDIADLLAALAGEGGLRWIRMLYGFPGRVSDRLIEVMAKQASVCQYLDLPFQHADREVLGRMRRPGEGERYLALIASLRVAMPDIALRSTFLVGFPGEGEGEFQRLLEFIEAAQLDRAGAFCYSREPGTPAAEMPDQVPGEVAQERQHQVMALQQRISLARNQRWVGRRMEVLIEARGEQLGAWVGRSFRDAPEVDGTVIVGSQRGLTPGTFVRATITEALEYDLVGEVADHGRSR
jgi:ribosomal protein S12 methylthiotransferase